MPTINGNGRCRLSDIETSLMRPIRNRSITVPAGIMQVMKKIPIADQARTENGSLFIGVSHKAMTMA